VRWRGSEPLGASLAPLVLLLAVARGPRRWPRMIRRRLFRQQTLKAIRAAGVPASWGDGVRRVRTGFLTADFVRLGVARVCVYEESAGCWSRGPSVTGHARGPWVQRRLHGDFEFGGARSWRVGRAGRPEAVDLYACGRSWQRMLHTGNGIRCFCLANCFPFGCGLLARLRDTQTGSGLCDN